MTDERLLEQAASGDETAFAVIYERHRGLVFRFAYRLSQSREMAEEITHDCFLSLIKEPQRFKTQEQRASLRTYLCAAARNLAFKRLRRTGAETAIDDFSEQLAAAESQEPLRILHRVKLKITIKPLPEDAGDEMRNNIFGKLLQQRWPNKSDFTVAPPASYPEPILITAVFSCVNRRFEENQELRQCSANWQFARLRR